MLWAIVLLLVIAWLLGLTVFNLGAIIHILLIIAVVVVFYNLIILVTGGRGTPPL